MILTCVTVVEIVERKTYQEGVYAVAAMEGVNMDERNFKWCLQRLETIPYMSRLGAAAHACKLANDNAGPYLPSVEHDHDVNEREYRTACKEQGVLCLLAEPEPEPEPATTEGAPA